MPNKSELLEKVTAKSVVIGIVGLGYVGLPLGLEFAEKHIKTIGFDVDEKKIPILMEGKTYIKHLPAERIKKAVDSGYFSATTDFSRLPEVDAILIAVPTPLDEHREPDMKYIVSSVDIIKKYLRKGQLVTLESTTYPGTTRELMLPEFENAPIFQQQINSNSQPQSLPQPLQVGRDFFLAFSPEREDPNNPNFNTATIPKVVGGITPSCLEIAQAIYDLVIVKTVPVSSPEVAEATKLLENIYRSINIALVNELKMVFDKMGIDVWEVINAAKTKPFGFNAFYPGPGLGGHCIPIDPFYLTWKAREFEINTKFIELAGEVNTYQPYYVVKRTMEVMNEYSKSLKGAKILLLGAAYKKNIDDMRESPSLKLIEILREKGAVVEYNDPYVDKLPATRKYNFDMQSVSLSAENIASYDLVLLSTDHDDYDYKHISENSKIIVDTRNAFEKNLGVKPKNVYKA